MARQPAIRDERGPHHRYLERATCSDSASAFDQDGGPGTLNSIVEADRCSEGGAISTMQMIGRWCLGRRQNEPDATAASWANTADARLLDVVRRRRDRTDEDDTVTRINAYEMGGVRHQGPYGMVYPDLTAPARVEDGRRVSQSRTASSRGQVHGARRRAQGDPDEEAWPQLRAVEVMDDDVTCMNVRDGVNVRAGRPASMRI